jgi:hypothetical protein
MVGVRMGDMVVTLPIDQQRRVRALSQQVRVLQAQLRGQDAATRRKLMEGEIEATVKTLPEAMRSVFIKELTAEFSRGVSVIKKVEAAPAPAPRVPKPAEAVDVLVGAWATLDEPSRKALVEKLKPLLGSAAQDMGPVVESAARALQLKSKESINPERVAAAFALLVRLARYVDNIWEPWPSIARAVKRPEESPNLIALLRQMVGGAVGTDSSRPGGRVPSAAEQEKLSEGARRAADEEIKKLGTAVSQMLFELPAAMRDFATEHVERFGSGPLRAEANKKKTGWGPSEEKLAWELFESRAASDMQEEVIVRKLTEHLEVRVRNAFQGREEATG